MTNFFSDDSNTGGADSHSVDPTVNEFLEALVVYPEVPSAGSSSVVGAVSVTQMAAAAKAVSDASAVSVPQVVASRAEFASFLRRPYRRYSTMFSTILSTVIGKVLIGSMAVAAATTGLAATGALPDPVQTFAAETVAVVGVNIPNPATDLPAPSDPVDPLASGAVTDPTTTTIVVDVTTTSVVVPTNPTSTPSGDLADDAVVSDEDATDEDVLAGDLVADEDASDESEVGVPVVDGLYTVDAAPAGSVLFQVSNGELTVLSMDMVDGWTQVDGKVSSDEIELRFTNGSDELKIEVSVKDAMLYQNVKFDTADSEEMQAGDDSDDSEIESSDAADDSEMRSGDTADDSEMSSDDAADDSEMKSSDAGDDSEMNADADSASSDTSSSSDDEGSDDAPDSGDEG